MRHNSSCIGRMFDQSKTTLCGSARPSAYWIIKVEYIMKLCAPTSAPLVSHLLPVCAWQMANCPSICVVMATQPASYHPPNFTQTQPSTASSYLASIVCLKPDQVFIPSLDLRVHESIFQIGSKSQCQNYYLMKMSWSVESLNCNVCTTL